MKGLKSNEMMKRIFSLGIGIVFFILIVSSAAALSGAGTAQDPYQITSCVDLNRTRDALSAYYKLMNDIDCSDTKNWDSGAGWIPIGDISKKFTGNFNGQGYKIINLTVNRNSTDRGSLFGWTDYANFTNIGMVDLNVSGMYNVGGLIGSSMYSKISNSYSTGSIYGVSSVGGLIGYGYSSTISNSYSKVNVIASGSSVGGLAGTSTTSTTISNSYSTGFVSGDKYVGGLVGNSYSGSTISNSYSTGSVEGNTQVGGLVGGQTNSDCYNSFWDKETSNQTTSALCNEGNRTTAEMKTKSTFTDASWDFTNIWGISGTVSSGYPHFLWQNPGTLHDTFDTETTNFDEVEDPYNVVFAVLKKAGSKISWQGIINAAGADFDSNTAFGFGFVSINASAFDQSINSTADVQLQVGGCDSFQLYYAEGHQTSMEDIVLNGVLVATQENLEGDCTDNTICTNVECSGTTLSFTALHFDGFGGSGGIIPEFSTITLMLAMVIVITGFFKIRKRTE